LRLISWASAEKKNNENKFFSGGFYGSEVGDKAIRVQRQGGKGQLLEIFFGVLLGAWST